MKTYLLATAVCAALIATGLSATHAADDRTREAIVGDALLNNGGYRLLETITTRFGARMAGSDGNTRSMDFLEEQLHALGITTRRDTYTIPGWSRLNDQVTLLGSPERPLRAAALGYVGRHDPIDAELIFVASSKIDDLAPDACRGKVGLVAPNLRFSQQEYNRLSDEFGLRGILLINRVSGGQLLARVANQDGVTPPFPIYSITVEDGRRMQRRLEDGHSVQVRIETNSTPAELTVDNLVAILPGTSGQRIVIGGHFDSWDLGQGAMDNGLGVAQLYDTARLLQAHSRQNAHTVEIVWFNAEEWGLWGSRDYVARHDLSNVRAMLNLDMVGRPIAVNAMGFDELVPLLDAFSERLGSWQFEEKAANKTWLGSDHHSFVLRGIPTITINGPIAPEDVRYYHDFADTFDKIDPEMLGRASAIIALLACEMANDSSSDIRHYNEEETAALFRKSGLEQRMRKAGKWPFASESDSAPEE